MGVFLYFLRHGQTAYSLTGGYCGTPENDPYLTLVVAITLCEAEAHSAGALLAIHGYCRRA
jgi:probable phosphoglycerate mutase